MSDSPVNDKAIKPNKTALITGASRGIGKAIALKMAKVGYDLLILGRKLDALNKVKNEVIGLNRQCKVFTCDIADSLGLINCLDKIVNNHYRIDVLVNNAGIYVTEQILDFNLAKAQLVLNTNLLASIITASKVALIMKKNGFGRIINISSISGVNGEVYGSSYAASKAGLIGFTKTAALELAKYNITVNCISPGWVNNEMAYSQLNDPVWCGLNNIDVSESLSIAKMSIPTQNLVEEDEVAHLVEFLASDQAKSITGQNINICGGLSIV